MNSNNFLRDKNALPNTEIDISWSTEKRSKETSNKPSARIQKQKSIKNFFNPIYPKHTSATLSSPPKKKLKNPVQDCTAKIPFTLVNDGFTSGNFCPKMEANEGYPNPHTLPPSEHLSQILQENEQQRPRLPNKYDVENFAENQRYPGSFTPRQQISRNEEEKEEEENPLKPAVNQGRLNEVFGAETQASGISSAEKFESICDKLKILYEKNKKMKVNQLIHNNALRNLNQTWVNHLVKEYKDKTTIKTILYFTPIIVFTNDTGENYILDGNHRIAALKKWNETSTTPITEITVEYFLTTEPDDPDKQILLNTAEKKVNKYKLPYDKMEIIRNCRMLLKHRFPLLKLPCKPTRNDETLTVPPREFGHAVRSALLKFIHVENLEKIPLCIWRTIWIEDDVFDTILGALATLKTSDMETALTRYPKAPQKILRLLESPEIYRNKDIWDAEFSKVPNWELLPWLINYKSDVKPQNRVWHMKYIMGENLYRKMTEEDRCKSLEKFLYSPRAASPKLISCYKSPDDRLAIIKKWYQKWLNNEAKTLNVPEKTSKLTRHSTKIQIKTIKSKELHDTFLKPLMDSDRSSIAAYICYVIDNYTTNKEKLKEDCLNLSNDYVINGVFDISKLPKDR